MRFTRNFGTKAARRAMKANGSKMTWAVPSRYGAFSWYRRLPFSVSDRRFPAITGRQVAKTIRLAQMTAPKRKQAPIGIAE
ncbi:hypothetical protein NB231_15013 [Nitrococcus mobilis Nb-231]|uniref:Uncharacterized protein n=1 Tax=Nitrococcus mobilis Nb-231 TaxID=314278 RepID=A4BLF3_9GAMM|nr:hypothetical protein NB231_15013 [Nitrococcus mobilis Nb-231]